MWDRAAVRRDSREPLLAVLLALALAGAACGAGDGGERRPPTAAPTPAAPRPPEVTALATLRSYRYHIELHAAGSALPPATTPAADTRATDTRFRIAIDGEVVNPDREHSRTKASLGFIELALERVQVGDRAWTRESGGEWKRATPGAPATLPGGELDISPARLFAAGGATFAALNREIGGIESREDAVNGIPARRYDFTPEQFRRIFDSGEGLLPGDSRPVQTRGSLWVAADTRVPVRIHLTAATADGAPAFELDMTLSDLNAEITIQPPA